MSCQVEMELQEITRRYEQMALGSELEVINKPSWTELPYRWELHSIDPPKWIATIQFSASDVIKLPVSTETNRQTFLRRKFDEALREAAELQHR